MPTIKEIKQIAKDRSIVFPPKMKKAEMIHTIQKQEGNTPCYAENDCSASDCLWFKDCQKEYRKNNK